MNIARRLSLRRPKSVSPGPVTAMLFDEKLWMMCLAKFVKDDERYLAFLREMNQYMQATVLCDKPMNPFATCAAWLLRSLKTAEVALKRRESRGKFDIVVSCDSPDTPSVVYKEVTDLLDFVAIKEATGLTAVSNLPKARQVVFATKKNASAKIFFVDDQDSLCVSQCDALLVYDAFQTLKSERILTECVDAFARSFDKPLCALALVEPGDTSIFAAQIAPGSFQDTNRALRMRDQPGLFGGKSIVESCRWQCTGYTGDFFRRWHAYLFRTHPTLAVDTKERREARRVLSPRDTARAVSVFTRLNAKANQERRAFEAPPTRPAPRPSFPKRRSASFSGSVRILEIESLTSSSDYSAEDAPPSPISSSPVVTKRE